MKALFIHIPKTAGTSIKAAFGDRVSYLGHHEPLTVEKALLYKDYFKFAFVRNSWARIASAYHGWRERCKRSPEVFPYNSFTEYVHDIIKGKSVIAKSQLWFISESGNMLVDFVGHYENLEEDFNDICEHINAHGVKLHNKFGYFGDYDYRQMYDIGLKNLIGDYYAEEIEFFHFSF